LKEAASAVKSAGDCAFEKAGINIERHRAAQQAWNGFMLNSPSMTIVVRASCSGCPAAHSCQQAPQVLGLPSAPCLVNLTVLYPESS
jgi:hypothetical protein